MRYTITSPFLSRRRGARQAIAAAPAGIDGRLLPESTGRTRHRPVAAPAISNVVKAKSRASAASDRSEETILTGRYRSVAARCVPVNEYWIVELRLWYVFGAVEGSVSVTFR